MSEQMTRRETLRMGMAGSLVALVPEWASGAGPGRERRAVHRHPRHVQPQPAQRRQPVPRSAEDRRPASRRPISSSSSSTTTSRRSTPPTYRLKVTGLVKKPPSCRSPTSRRCRSVDIVNGYECSGNSPRAMQGLSSNGRFTGVRLRDVLRRAGVGDKAREVVFFGADRGNEDVVFRQQTLQDRSSSSRAASRSRTR